MRRPQPKPWSIFNQEETVCDLIHWLHVSSFPVLAHDSFDRLQPPLTSSKTVFNFRSSCSEHIVAGQLVRFSNDAREHYAFTVASILIDGVNATSEREENHCGLHKSHRIAPTNFSNR